MYNYEDVNAGLEKIIEYLNSIDHVFNETRNLKLYDAYYQASDIIEKYPLVKEKYNESDPFYWFCEDSYEQFIEWMKEEGIEDCRKYIGHTSSFYLTDIHDSRIDYIISNLFDTVNGGYYEIDLDESGKMIHFTDTEYYTEAEQIEEYQEGMEYIAAGEFLEDIKKYFSDAVKIANYIDDTKDHQVEYFEEFIQCQNETLEYEAEQATKKEKAFNKKYNKIITALTKHIAKIIRATGGNMTDTAKIINEALDNTSKKPETI